MSDPSTVPPPMPMTIQELIENNDAITGGLITVQSQLRPVIDKVDDLCTRQAKFSDNLEKLLTTAAIGAPSKKKEPPPKAGPASLTMLVAVFFLGGVAANYTQSKAPEVSTMSSPYDEGIRLMRCDPPQYSQAGKCFLQAGTKPGADPNKCLGRLAECLFRMKNYEEVLAICHQLEEFVPESPQAAFWRAAVYKENGNKSAAIEWFTKAHDRGEPLAGGQLSLLQPSAKSKKKEK